MLISGSTNLEGLLSEHAWHGRELTPEPNPYIVTTEIQGEEATFVSIGETLIENLKRATRHEAIAFYTFDEPFSHTERTIAVNRYETHVSFLKIIEPEYPDPDHAISIKNLGRQLKAVKGVKRYYEKRA